MRERMKKIILAIVSVIIILNIMPFDYVSAKEAGSIEITETATNTSSKQVVAGVKLSLYKIADVDADEDVGYRITNNFSGSGICARDIVYTENLSKIAENLSKYAADHAVGAELTQTTDKNGYLKFTGLSDGIYLVRQVNEEDDFERIGYRYTTEPYIVAIPSTDSAGNEVRNVVCQPKGVLTKQEEKDTSLTVYKVWKDHNDKKGIRPATIKIGLYRDGKLEEKVNLSAGNNWMYAWNGLDADSNWSVKELEIPTGYKSSISNNNQMWTVTNTYTSQTIVKTGDSNHIFVWFSLGCVSLLGIMIVIKNRKCK